MLTLPQGRDQASPPRPLLRGPSAPTLLLPTLPARARPGRSSLLSGPVPGEACAFLTWWGRRGSQPGLSAGLPCARPAEGAGPVPAGGRQMERPLLASLRRHIEAETFAGDIRTAVLPKCLGWQWKLHTLCAHFLQLEITTCVRAASSKQMSHFMSWSPPSPPSYSTPGWVLPLSESCGSLPSHAGAPAGPGAGLREGGLGRQVPVRTRLQG